jgi:hypothetical protein
MFCDEDTKTDVSSLLYSDVAVVLRERVREIGDGSFEDKAAWTLKSARAAANLLVAPSTSAA